MTSRNYTRYLHGSMVGLVAVVPMMTNCAALCCKEFVPGADMATVDFGVDASFKDQYAVIAQAAGDMSAAATGALADVEAACTAIATDLGADISSLNSSTGNARVTAACNLAAAEIAKVFPSQIAVSITPAVCSASIKAQATCQGKCSGSVACDVKVHPPTCAVPGKLEVSCKGTCKAEVSGGSIDCTGKCSGSCSGECRATGASVTCNGRCDGTCEGTTDTGGNCNGKCNGNCKVTGGGVSCEGQCNGSCNASCTATEPTAKFSCSGKCDGEFEPIRCTGGKLEGGCTVDAQCNASCDASLQAKAECTPPSVKITSNASSEKVAALFATLERNLPALLNTVQGRGKVFVDSAVALANGIGKLAENSGKLGVKGVACAGTIVEAAANASAGAPIALSAAAKVTLSVGVGEPK